MKRCWIPRQFTLRQLLAGVTVACILVGLCSRWYSRYRAQDAAMNAIVNKWGVAGYCLEVKEQGHRRYGSSELVNFVGKIEGITYLDCDMFFQVDEISFPCCSGGRMTDVEVALLFGLPYLERAHLNCNREITDRSVPVLANLKSLKYLGIHRTEITSGGAEKLRKALPQTEIYYEMSESASRKRDG